MWASRSAHNTGSVRSSHLRTSNLQRCRSVKWNMLLGAALAAATISLPSIAISVNVAPGIPRPVVDAPLNEAAAIWGRAGVALIVADSSRSSGQQAVTPAEALSLSSDTGEITV